MKRNIRIVLKSGYSFVFLCENMKAKRFGDELTGYSFTGATDVFPMYIRIDDVAAIIDEGESSEVST